MQNRVALAKLRLPAEGRHLVVTRIKSSPDVALVVGTFAVMDLFGLVPADVA